MSSTEEDPASAAALTGSRVTSICGDGPHPTKYARKKQAISALKRDFVAEALRIAAVKAAHAADDIEIGGRHDP